MKDFSSKKLSMIVDVLSYGSPNEVIINKNKDTKKNKLYFFGKKLKLVHFLYPRSSKILGLEKIMGKRNIIKVRLKLDT